MFSKNIFIKTSRLGMETMKKIPAYWVVIML
jgi:hypothetical protein